MPKKTVYDIIDSDLEKNNQILIIYGTGINIPDTTGHQVPSSPNICFCIT